MATAAQSAGKKSAKSKASTAKKTTTARKTPQKDAVALLKADHREVEGWFSQFEKAKSDAKKLELVQKILLALKVHTQVEEELFYPPSREFVKDDEIVDEAVVEHDAAKKLMAEIEAMQPSDDMYDAKVKVLSEMIEHHVEEEEKEYFPQCQKSDMDLKAIGEQIMMRKKELMTELQPAQMNTVQ
ncbi:hemerythrin domain-containing protein [Phenylobacterium sp.]|jgi:hemerythrin superfamily protein|uniref:hemerythrin domain-containing protein n=1 Tax=Phenylobacterium sp. TaxID=1871053 RepID=UPI002E34F1B0|nr:hemerythrin domain-containing protein [Phenylobacterium sp.]HEX2559758.1 hemerythrin domain-containing protein [Phenylobacterium sp.]